MFVFLFLSCQVLSTKVFLPQSNPGQGQEQTQETEDKKEREGEGNKKKGAGKILWVVIRFKRKSSQIRD